MRDRQWRRLSSIINKLIQIGNVNISHTLIGVWKITREWDTIRQQMYTHEYIFRYVYKEMACKYWQWIGFSFSSMPAARREPANSICLSIPVVEEKYQRKHLIFTELIDLNMFTHHTTQGGCCCRLMDFFFFFCFYNLPLNVLECFPSMELMRKE